MRTASLAEYLGRRYDLDVIVFRQPGDPDPASLFPPGLARQVKAIDLPYHSRTTAARLGRNARRLVRGIPPLNDRFAGFGTEISALTADRHYSTIVVEHFWCAPYAEQLGDRCARLILDLHNIESRLYQSLADVESGFPRLVFRRFESAARRLERVWLARYSLVLTASAEDSHRLCSIDPAAKTLVYPNALPSKDQPAPAVEDTIVFSGNLEYPPNGGAVRFFGDRVWPLILAARSDIRWRLVGKNPRALAGLLDGRPAIEIVGPVDDAIAAIAESKIAVVPVFSGSGTRIKILEAWAAGVPVVSTTLGAEGLGAIDGKHLLLADSPQEFARAVMSLLSDDSLHARVRQAARTLYEQRFTWTAVWKRLEEAGV